MKNSFLLSSLFTSLNDNPLQSNLSNPIASIDKSCNVPHDIIKVILYESYIPLEALVFEIGISKMNKSELKNVVSKVLESKKMILKNPKSISKVFNTSEKNNEPGEFKELLKFRQNLISTDQSMIFESLIKENLQMILECVETLKDKAVLDPKTDQNYMKMANRLYDAIYENVDIQEALRKEKAEFYRNFQVLSHKSKKEAKIAISLGSTVINLKDLLAFSSKLKSKNREILIREWIRLIFDSIETLSIEISSKDFIDQKSEIIKFISDSTGYEVRTMILKALEMEDNEIEEFMIRQRKENERITDIVANIREPQWIVKYNKQIREDMVEYLLTLQPEDKKKVLNHFQAGQ